MLGNIVDWWNEKRNAKVAEVARRTRHGFALLTVVALLWFGCAAGQDLRYLSHQSWGTEEGLPQNSVHAIAQTPDGFLWVATEGGLARFDGVGFKVYSRPELPSDDVCCLKVAEDGALLVGTAGGMIRMRGDKFAVAAAPLPDGTVGKTPDWAVRAVGGQVRVQAVLVDREGLGGVGMKQGLAVIDLVSGKVQRVAALQNDSVLALFEDAEGNHWVGTETSGLHLLRRLKFRSEAGLAGLAVTSVAETDDGAMWVGTRDDGLRKVADGVVSEPIPVEKLTSGVILCMAVDDAGSLWVGTPDGLNLIDPRGRVTRVTSADGLPDDYVRSLAEQHGSRSAMWVGTRKGMARVLAGRVEQVLAAKDGLAGDLVGAMVDSPGGVLVETSGGLSVVSSDWTVKPFAKVAGFGKAIVTAMVLDRAGQVWLATNDGRLGRLDGGRFVEFGQYPADDPILGMTADGQGDLWLRMKRGIWRVDLKKLPECAAMGRCGEPGVRYGVSDGLPTEEAVAGESAGGWLTLDGSEIWFPARRGLGVVDLDRLPVDRVPPPVAIERFLVDGVVAENGDAIPYGQSRVLVEYAGLSFTAPAQVRYRVMLEGFDKGWADVGGRRSATYTNLPPGEYAFRVTAVNGDGLENHVGATLRFRVVPPFYLRWGFISLMVLVVLALLAGLYWLRLRRLRRDFDVRLAERTRMAREIHDTLTQDFVGASLQLDIVAQQLKRGKVEAALEQVARTRRLVSEGLDEARRSIWELRDGDAGESLPARLKLLAERAAIPVAVHVGGAYRVLAPEVEREVLRIAQESLKNVEHHAKATEVLVNLHYSDEAALLTIEDNGVGFRIEDAASKAGHFGLLGMRERAAGIGGGLDVASEPGVGTKVTLRVPG